jgi:hypothetical protein
MHGSGNSRFRVVDLSLSAGELGQGRVGLGLGAKFRLVGGTSSSDLAQLQQLQADADWVGADLETCIERLERMALPDEIANITCIDAWPADLARLRAASPPHSQDALHSLTGTVHHAIDAMAPPPSQHFSAAEPRIVAAGSPGPPSACRAEEQPSLQQLGERAVLGEASAAGPGGPALTGAAGRAAAPSAAEAASGSIRPGEEESEGEPAPQPRPREESAALHRWADPPLAEPGAPGAEGCASPAPPHDERGEAPRPGPGGPAPEASPAASRRWACRADPEGGGEGGGAGEVEVTLREPDGGAECPITLGPMAASELDFLPGVQFFRDEPRLREVRARRRGPAIGPGGGARRWGPAMGFGMRGGGRKRGEASQRERCLPSSPALVLRLRSSQAFATAAPSIAQALSPVDPVWGRGGGRTPHRLRLCARLGRGHSFTPSLGPLIYHSF